MENFGLKGSVINGDTIQEAQTMDANTIINAVRVYATVGEMCDALRDVWGEYEEVPII